MLIIIDAYNFFKQIDSSGRVTQEFIKTWLLTFQRYITLRSNRVELVFDAGPYWYESIEYYGHLKVLYSGQGKTADAVIKKRLSEYQGKDILLITSDREICHYADELDIISIGSIDFYRIFQEVMARYESYEEQVSGTLYKTSATQSEELDKLMEQGSRGLVKTRVVNDELVEFRISNGKKSSKMDKRLLAKIEKI